MITPMKMSISRVSVAHTVDSRSSGSTIVWYCLAVRKFFNDCLKRVWVVRTLEGTVRRVGADSLNLLREKGQASDWFVQKLLAVVNRLVSRLLDHGQRRGGGLIRHAATQLRSRQGGTVEQKVVVSVVCP
mmetsp:Transcript_71340/g.163532  ORF Transcript_71340/g.163532 Transcript_71340/m.163532 type:complete len:130 (+) Transcript_71340:793-1182(+)